MSARLRRVAAALGGFLKGFLGLEAAAGGLPRVRSAGGVRRALERRAARRRSCC